MTCSTQNCALTVYCKSLCKRHYMRSRYEANKERHKEQMGRWYRENKADLREKRRRYYQEHKAEYATRFRKWQKSNPEVANARAAKRRSDVLRATPVWSDLEKIKEIYALAKDLSWLSEGGLHVDHIVPLKGKNVCGLHVPENLQIIPAPDNYRKWNKHGS